MSTKNSISHPRESLKAAGDCREEAREIKTPVAVATILQAEPTHRYVALLDMESCNRYALLRESAISLIHECSLVLCLPKIRQYPHVFKHDDDSASLYRAR